MTDDDQPTGDASTDRTHSTDGGRLSRRGALAALTGLGALGLGSGTASAVEDHDHLGEAWKGDPAANYGLRVAAQSDTRFGIQGFTQASNGRGVVGRAFSSTGTTRGVIGRVDSHSDGAAALSGFADASSGTTFGMIGRSDSDSGTGVDGRATADSGTTYGVTGRVTSSDGYGLHTPDDAKIDGTVETDRDWVLDLDIEGFHEPGNVVVGSNENWASNSNYGGTIAGGGEENGPNVVTADFGTVSGGWDNVASKESATVGGGRGHRASGEYTTISGGGHNEATEWMATIAGGNQNDARARCAVILGGKRNEVYAPFGSIGGGYGNAVESAQSRIGGGSYNQAGIDDGDSSTGKFATVGGGKKNTATGTRATISGGYKNTASGRSSFAAGEFAAAEHDHAFVWADGSDSESDPFSSGDDPNGSGVTGARTFHVKASNGARFVNSAGTTYIPSGSTGWSTASARATKTNVDPMDPQDALAGVESLEVATWEYEGEDGGGTGVTHVGPMAGDFHDAFDVGDSDEHINSINADGVAFAAIQGLAERLDRENERLREQLAEKDDRIDDLEARLASLEAQVGADTAADD